MAVTTSWPDTLPLPTYEGYGVEPTDSILRTEMESGPARQRQRYTQTPTSLPVRWRFTTWQYGIFESWFKHKGKEGGAWFSINLLGGLGMVSHEARFVGQGSKPYSATPYRGGRWIVTSLLEVRERPVLSEDALDVVLVEDAVGLMAAVDAVDTAVNDTLPDQHPW